MTGGDPVEIAVFKKQMTCEFEMSDLGLLSFYLGIEVEQQEDCITIKQTSYAKKVLSQFGMIDCNQDTNESRYKGACRQGWCNH